MKIQNIILAGFAALGILSSSMSCSESELPIKPEFIFQANDQLASSVKAATQQAIEQDKLLLLVLGAQWCHDSRGLAQQFSSESLNPIIQERFEVVFVDIGYYQDLRWLTQQYDYPGYFATPSVMVIQPEQSTLLNRQTMPIWNNAHSVEPTDYVDYFAQIGTTQPPELTLPTEKRAQLTALAAQQTDRLFAGFKQLGPMIKTIVEQQSEDTTEVEALADEIYQFRMALQLDINELYIQASEQPAAPLALADYGPFSWERSEEL